MPSLDALAQKLLCIIALALRARLLGGFWRCQGTSAAGSHPTLITPLAAEEKKGPIRLSQDAVENLLRQGRAELLSRQLRRDMPAEKIDYPKPVVF